MGIWHVQTWTVTKGKYQEHDELWKRWLEFGEGKTDTKLKGFDKLLGPIGGRVLLMQFDSYAEYEQWFAKWTQDEEFVQYQQDWLTLIDPNSWKGFFWQETELSLNW